MAKKNLGGRPRTKPKPRLFARRFGAGLKARRVYLGISRADLGHAVDRSVSQIFRWESGEIEMGVDMLATVADALGWSPSELLDAALK